MGDRTIELTITNGLDDYEEARAGRLFVLDHILPAPLRNAKDAEYDRFMFEAHDEHGDEYVVVMLNEPSTAIWHMLWTEGAVTVIIDRGMAMRAIPHLPPASDEKPITREVK